MTGDDLEDYWKAVRPHRPFHKVNGVSFTDITLTINGMRVPANALSDLNYRSMPQREKDAAQQFLKDWKVTWNG